MNQKYFYDLHCHTLNSKDSPTTLEDIIKVAKERGLDGVAITDHNHVYQGSDHIDGIDIIAGSEITLDNKGHLLAFFIKENIPCGLSLEETVSLIINQGGYSVLAHPFREENGLMVKKDTENIKKVIRLIDGLESGNSSDKKEKRNMVLDLFENYPGSFFLTAGSDAHISGQVGFAVVEVDEKLNKDNFREVLNRGRVIVKEEATIFIKEVIVFKKNIVFLSKLLMINKSEIIKNIFFKILMRNYLRIKNRRFLKIKFSYNK